MNKQPFFFGLLPITWAPAAQSGADVKKRIAAPVVGGVVTSGILELLLYPVIYILWPRRHLAAPLARPSSLAGVEKALIPVAVAPSHSDLPLTRGA